MATAIKVENLSKIYRLGEIGTGTISKDLERFVKTKILKQEDPFLKIGESNDRLNKGSSDIVYSLKNINFEIKQGDAVGIIGSNGAGKSTLLKILSRVTSPSTGKINVKGRIASLLEVGTGFHPELTGRENIYLNGAILGMRKKEIDRKFDEIVDFSGVERYIDTPVKRYSSGMYVRLAFAVAAHLESEILIVDEVLAVGDAEFQKKCVNKMSHVSKEQGRTILFVSHNMGAVKQLCNSGILIEKGIIKMYNRNIDLVVTKYLQADSSIATTIWKNIEKKYQSEYFTLISLYLTNSSGDILPKIVDNSENFFLNFEFEVETIDNALEISYEVYDEEHRLVYCSQHTDQKEDKWTKISKGYNKIQTIIPSRFLNEGLYYIKPGACLYNRMSILEPTKNNISLQLNILGGLSDSPYWSKKRGGIIAPLFKWGDGLC
jgi:lipopolysaccharide transport system ATP-binding protein